MLKIADIIKAKNNFGSFIKETPLEYSERLSKEYKAEIYLKREDLQPVRSYKIRGAYNIISSLTEEERKKGVVAASAGNHAQGVAISCSELQIKGTIYMPLTTPEQKVYKTKKFGGEYIDVKLIGDSFDDAYSASINFQKETGASFIHPFDDPKGMEGQATIGLEIIDSMKSNSPDYIICPIGGGGLISGIISVMSELSPSSQVIGVEPAGAPAMKHSLEAGKNTSLHKIDTFVDGAAVKKVGDNTFEIAKNYGLEIHTTPENRICSTILEYLREDGIVVEPAGALSTDILKDLRDKIKGKKIVCIVSGSNFDFERLPEVKERSMKYEGRKRYVIVSFPQRPGALREFLDTLGEGDDIVRFEYLKKTNKNRAPALIGLESTKAENFEALFEKMKSRQIKFEDITDNEVYFDLLI